MYNINKVPETKVCVDALFCSGDISILNSRTDN